MKILHYLASVELSKKLFCLKKINLINTYTFTAIFWIITIGILPLTNSAQIIFNQALADPNDVFSVISPQPNAILRSNVIVSWLMSDNEQSQIPFTTTLNDNATCQTQLANISPTNTGPSSGSQYFFNWNTSQTQSGNSLPDGNYCLKICLVLKKGSQTYSACNGRSIRLVNNNSLPQIISFPQNLSINETESWSYQINAIDAQGDALSYRLIQSAPFLTINQSTGLITTNSVSRALPAGIYSAIYTIIVGVNDNMSGEATQQFQLTISRPIPPPVSNNNAIGDNQTITNGGKNNQNNNNIGDNQQLPNDKEEDNIKTPVTNSTNAPGKINFITNLLNQTISEDSFEFKYNASDPEGIKSISIFIIPENDLENELLLKEMSNEDIDLTVNVDTTNLINGKYFLRIKLIDNANVTTIKDSEIFSIERKDQEIPDNELPKEDLVALIINNIPQNNSDIYERRPTISGEFLPSQGSQVDTETISFSINDVNFLDSCQIDQRGFVCTPIEPLSLGTQKIVIKFTDTNGITGQLQININVKDISTITPPNYSTITLFGNEIPLGTVGIVALVCCATLLLLFIPWLIITRLTKQNQFNSSAPDNIQIDEVNSASDEFDEFLKSASQPKNFTTPAPDITTEIIKTEDPSSDNLDEYLSYISPNNQIPEEVKKDMIQVEHPNKEIIIDEKNSNVNLDEFIEPEATDVVKSN
jgi:hypothetical protein